MGKQEVQSYGEALRVAAALREIRDGQLYRNDGYGTFEEFCLGEFGMPVTIAERLIRELTASEAATH